MYRTFEVYRVDAATGQLGEIVGSVDAESAAQAAFRLAGGEWGRDDFRARPLDYDEQPQLSRSLVAEWRLGNSCPWCGPSENIGGNGARGKDRGFCCEDCGEQWDGHWCDEQAELLAEQG